MERKGFEPLTPAVQKRCSSQTELTPHLESELSFLVIRLLNLLQFFISYIMTVITNGIELTTNCFALDGIFTFYIANIQTIF